MVHEGGRILLIAYETGLPAMARILEEKSCNRPFIAHIENPGRDDIQADLQAKCAVNWHTGFGSIPGSTKLTQIAESFRLPDGPGQIWVAGKAKALTALRRHLHNECGVPKDFVKAIGYWIIGKPRD